MNDSKIVVLIPARKGSKGILNKNIKMLGGIPLVAHSILLAKRCLFIDEIYVSSDSKNILKIAEKYGATPLLRSDKNSSDTSSTEDVMIELVKK